MTTDSTLPTATPSPGALSPNDSLADLATRLAGASRVFQRHRLDFCCNGQRSLADACEQAGIDPTALLDELRTEQADDPAPSVWGDRPLADLIEHLLTEYHAAHREELPRLTAMATKVERVHAERPGCPKGLAQCLETFGASLEQHMEKEEQILFPLLTAGRGNVAGESIRVIESEHDDHGATLERLREITGDHRAPDGACATWRALYLGLEQLERDLMSHVHLENHVLFPRALREEAAAR